MVNSLYKSKKAQVWYADLILALLVFTAILTMYYKTDINTSQQDNKNLNELTMEARIVTNDILSQGIPKAWNKTNVRKIGIMDNNRINMTKLVYFSELPYNDTKSYLRTKYDYYLYFKRDGNIIKINGKDGIGKPGVNATNLEQAEKPNKVIRLTRIVILEHDPARMEFIIWE